MRNITNVNQIPEAELVEIIKEDGEIAHLVNMQTEAIILAYISSDFFKKTRFMLVQKVIEHPNTTNVVLYKLLEDSTNQHEIIMIKKNPRYKTVAKTVLDTIQDQDVSK